MNEFFEQSLHGHIAHVQLNRPERLNTMAPAFFPALRDTVRRLHEEGAARVLVISSTGRHFSAGMSLDVFEGSGGNVRKSPDDRRDPSESAAREAVGLPKQCGRPFRKRLEWPRPGNSGAGLRRPRIA